MADLPPAARIHAVAAAELPALARFAEACFRATYAPTHEAAALDAYCARAFAPATLAADLADANAAALVAVAAAPGEAPWDGYVQLRLAPPPAAAGGPVRPTVAAGAAGAVEVVRLYVHPERQGRGLGRALLDAAAEWGRSRGAGQLWLQVWEENHTARAFYAREGLRAAGERTFDFAGTLERDLVLARAIAP